MQLGWQQPAGQGTACFIAGVELYIQPSCLDAGWVVATCRWDKAGFDVQARPNSHAPRASGFL